MTVKKPLLALTMGDAAGIGPEIIAKSLACKEIQEQANILLIADKKITQQAIAEFYPEKNKPNLIDYNPKHIGDLPTDSVYIFQPGKDLCNIVYGEVSKEAGRGSAEYLFSAIELAKKGLVTGIVTAPLNKEALKLAGYNYPGHTEILAEKFATTNFSMVLTANKLFCFHATSHIPLKDVADSLNQEKVYAQIQLADLLCQALNGKQETIAVAGLNPHAGENNIFGNEESVIIKPAIAKAQRQNIPVIGPLPADVLFPKAMRGEYNFVVAMYHDQGHAVFKSFYFDTGVNITVGLPVIRTSVDHGTAFDIAGKNLASPNSLNSALILAAKIGSKWPLIHRKAQEILNTNY